MKQAEIVWVWVCVSGISFPLKLGERHSIKCHPHIGGVTNERRELGPSGKVQVVCLFGVKVAGVGSYIGLVREGRGTCKVPVFRGEGSSKRKI